MDNIEGIGATIHQAHMAKQREEMRDAELASLRAEVELLKDLCGRMKLEAQIHAQEARTSSATIAEIYQCVTGSTGEPGNWNGANPVRERIETLIAALKVARLAMAFKTKPLCMCFAGCGECQPDPMPPTLEEAIATIDEALK